MILKHSSFGYLPMFTLTAITKNAFSVNKNGSSKKNLHLFAGKKVDLIKKTACLYKK